MAVQEIINRINRIEHLIKMKATGSPDELALRLNISKRQVYRYIEMIRNQGVEVEYEASRRSYIYKA